MEEITKREGIFVRSIGKKLIISVGILVLLLMVTLVITYTLNRQISQDQTYIRDVNTPLSLMVAQVVGYDAMLTGDAHDALLHTEQREFNYLETDKKDYDAVGAKLDRLLKIDAPNLINKSRRSQAEKDLVYGYLRQLDKVNLELVELESGAFDAMEKGDIAKARLLIVSDEYDGYRTELAKVYQKWLAEENRVADYYRQRVLSNSRNVQIYNVYLGILFLLIASLIPIYLINRIVKPVRALTEATEELKKGNFGVRANIKTGDELEILGNSFNRTAEQLEKTDAERKQIDKAKTEFLSITSHELRSPMTPMQAQLQMLMEDYFGKLNSKQRESLEIVLRNTQRLDRIIQDFLEISRIEAARLKFNFVSTNLGPYIKRTVEEMSAFMPEKKIKIKLDSERLPNFEVDSDRVMQVLRNLLNNAIKFSRDGGKIEVSVKMGKGQILFVVKDDGEGIPQKDQARIFEPFFQAGGMYERKVGGTGLGLAICKGIIESQGGRIWFNSLEGKGTTFQFTIPLEPVREMKPIKVLFSNKENVENEIKRIMIEYLGPLGEKEFEDLKLKGLTEEVFNGYIHELHRAGIITKAEEFKKNIREILSGNKKEEIKVREKKINISDLERAGLVKGGGK